VNYGSFDNIFKIKSPTPLILDLRCAPLQGKLGQPWLAISVESV